MIGLMGGVFNGRVDVLSFEKGIIGQNLVEGCAVGEKLKNVADANTLTANAGRPPHLPSSTVIRLSLSARIFDCCLFKASRAARAISLAESLL